MLFRSRAGVGYVPQVDDVFAPLTVKENLQLAGMSATDYDVQYFPRWRTQRHQFGAAGYALLRTSKKQEAAWEFGTWVFVIPHAPWPAPGRPASGAARGPPNAVRPAPCRCT